MMSELKKGELLFAPIPKRKDFKNLTGKKFGRLTVLGFFGRFGKPSRWYCECDCGKITITRTSGLRSGKSKSCGCYRMDVISGAKKEINYENGLKKPEYSIYNAAKQRCENGNTSKYHRYGGRGICFGYKSFEEFLDDVGRRPTKKHSIDRIDNNKGYYPGNCRWATSKEQSRNLNKNITGVIDGKKYRVIDFFKEARGTDYGRVITRIIRGWEFKAAVFAPANQPNNQKMKREVAINYVRGKSLEELAKAAGLIVPTPIGKAAPPRKIGETKEAA